MSRRWLLLIVVVLTCCREIEPFSPSGPFFGYQVNGIVTNANGVPLEGVSLRLFYEYGGRYAALDTAQLRVYDTLNTIRVEVFDADDKLVRWFTVLPYSGYLQRNVWDEKDSTASDVKSGLYRMLVYFNTSLVKQSRWLVDGKVSAVTDVSGQFSILNSSLPVGEIVDLYDQQGSYFGTYEILPTIRLVVPSAPGSVLVTLFQNQITRISLTL